MSTPSMTLFHNPASPFVRKVLVLLHETGQQDRVALQLSQLSPVKPDRALIDDNPLSKIPALRLANGTVIHDSRVILDYLDHQHVGNPLIPRDGAARWRRLTLASLADGIMDAAVMIRYETALRPVEKNTGTNGSMRNGTRFAGPWACSKPKRLPNWPATSTWPPSAWPAPWATWTCAIPIWNGARPIRNWRRGLPRSVCGLR
nr:hypothetical protein GCM10020185_40450 [Pseudomonas brassicacearum subsp. brassicacearum]